METKLGVFYTCFTEKKAVQYSLEKLFEIYPEIPVYLVSDGGSDYSFLYDIFPGKKLKCCLEEDTRGIIAVIDRAGDFFSEKNQKIMIHSVDTFLKRLNDAIKFCNSKHLLVMEPDVLVRGKLTIPEESVYLTGGQNKIFNSLCEKKMKKFFSKYEGSIYPNKYGMVPIFSTEHFKKIYSIFQDDKDLVKKLYLCDPHFPYYDRMFSIIFALIGHREEFNPEVTECFRDKKWEKNGKPLVHQFRKYYPSREEHNSIYSTEGHYTMNDRF